MLVIYIINIYYSTGVSHYMWGAACGGMHFFLFCFLVLRSVNVILHSVLFQLFTLFK